MYKFSNILSKRKEYLAFIRNFFLTSSNGRNNYIFLFLGLLRDRKMPQQNHLHKGFCVARAKNALISCQGWCMVEVNIYLVHELPFPSANIYVPSRRKKEEEYTSLPASYPVWKIFITSSCEKNNSKNPRFFSRGYIFRL